MLITFFFALLLGFLHVGCLTKDSACWLGLFCYAGSVFPGFVVAMLGSWMSVG